MLNNEFEKQVESAMLLIAQEQISDTPHRFPPDFEARLVQQSAERVRIRYCHSILFRALSLGRSLPNGHWKSERSYVKSSSKTNTSITSLSMLIRLMCIFM